MDFIRWLLLEVPLVEDDDPLVDTLVGLFTTINDARFAGAMVDNACCEALEWM
jgi:hypothetical protein